MIHISKIPYYSIPKELTIMYTIITTHGHYEIRDGPTFIQSADTYREAQHELASLINSPT